MFAVAALFLAVASDVSSVPATTNNDDSCEISTAPAATLLLPYFEVETAKKTIDTVFTIVNVSDRTQIARVTLWSDWSYPVLTFDIRLTGYDVQPVSLYDLLAFGALPPGCASSPAALPLETAAAVRSALNEGKLAGCPRSIGSPASWKRISTIAAGYATIDVVNACGSTSPNDPSYIANELLFDNVLTGDYQTIDRTAGGNYAAGNPLVHVRAVPEGGPAGTPLRGHQTNLPYTFYSRFINGQKVGGTTYGETLMNYDRRQPLPSTFAARFLEGGAGSFRTDFKIWREGRTGPVTCANASSNSALPVSETVRFDEHENPNTYNPGVIITSVPATRTTPATSRTSTADEAYPRFSSPAGDSGGWMYINTNSGLTRAAGLDTALHPNFPTPRPSQGWVTASISGPSGSAAGLYATEFDATHLGNGCTPATAISTINGGLAPVGPSGGVLVCPGRPACSTTTPPYTGTNATP